MEDLENAIDRCKDLVTHTEEFSIERKWLVRHLVELRFRLNEIVECLEDPKYKPSNTMVIFKLDNRFEVTNAIFHFRQYLVIILFQVK